MTYHRDVKTWLKIIFFSLLVVVTIGYSAFQARKIVEGPRISLLSPQQGTHNSPLVDVTGTASNISELSLNNRPIYTDEKGNFSEKLLLFSGYNIIKLDAKDKFGKETNKKVEVYLIKS